MHPIWLLVGVLALGDLVLAYVVWREREKHRLTRAALRFWRREANQR